MELIQNCVILQNIQDKNTIKILIVPDWVELIPTASMIQLRVHFRLSLYFPMADLWIPWRPTVVCERSFYLICSFYTTFYCMTAKEGPRPGPLSTFWPVSSLLNHNFNGMQPDDWWLLFTPIYKYIYIFIYFFNLKIIRSNAFIDIAPFQSMRAYF